MVLASAAHILKIGTIQRRLAWPLRKDDTQIHEAFHIFSKASREGSKEGAEHLNFMAGSGRWTKPILKPDIVL